MKYPLLYQLLNLIVKILIPIVLVLLSVRALLTPLFVQIEYRTPGFPSDSYGFTLQDRLVWSNIAIEYLINTSGIEYLGDLKFGDGTSVYNERELEHMVDVKVVVQKALLILYFSIGVLLLLGGWARVTGWWQLFLSGLAGGGKLTILILLAIILFVLLSFNVFFVAFHSVFFEAGTWVFQYSDTLIRLFPERFWRDSFIFVGGISILSGGIFWVLFRHNK